MTEQLKPVAWYTEDREIDKSATTYNAVTAERWRKKGWPVGTLHEAIPPTHRVVSVELLEKAINVIAWTEHPIVSQLRAIIDGNQTEREDI